MIIRNKLGQVTISIIVALVIVVGIILVVVFRDNLFGGGISAEFSPIYNLYEECIKQETENAVDLLGTQGGRIDSGEFTPGNTYSPFSSHLNFLGRQVPYWYYLSGNNLIKENIPTKSDMENEVSLFLEERINDCDFSEFYQQGFFLDFEEPRISTSITEENVLVDVIAPLSVSKEDRSARKVNHRVEVQSKIGKFYEEAIGIYDLEKESLFLENYAVDVLNLYAPVEGVEIQCNPKIWKTPEVVEDLKEGLEKNIGSVKLRGDYYNLDEKNEDYFVIDKDTDEAVNFVYFADEFPSKIEITPASQTLMVAQPIGNQEGLGILGFCYVPYHFVYDVSFPVMVQITDGLEIFQFPLTVIIDNNFPGQIDLPEIYNLENRPDICSFSEGEIEVKTFDVNLNPVEAEISYNCFNSLCELGSTKIDNGEDAILNSGIPVCLNGYIIAKAKGYAEKKQLFSSNSENFAEIILDREYEVEVELKIAGRELKKGTAIIHFNNNEGSVSAIFPEVQKVNLKEDLYDIEVYVYEGSNIVIPSSEKRECFETTRSGILGFFGGKREECVKVEIPEFKIDSALSGGGKTTNYILESDLQDGKIVIDVSELPKPDSLEQLQYNYEVFETLGVNVE